MDYLAGKLGPVLLETVDPSSPCRFLCSGSPDALIMSMHVERPERASGSEVVGIRDNTDAPA
jgi:hypothetical protein